MQNIERMLKDKGADIVRFVDISGLPHTQTQGFSKAIVFCMALKRDFILAMRDGKQIEHDDFVEKEHAADALADELAEYIRQRGHRAYSQSEESNFQNGNFNPGTKSSKLPHKTIARLAGLGYIGKNNLLIHEEFGCAFSMCTVLTDAPIVTKNYPSVSEKCGFCDICRQVCPDGAILGNEWSENGGREAVVDVFKCTCGLKCMVNCPQTLAYALQSDGEGK